MRQTIYIAAFMLPLYLAGQNFPCRAQFEADYPHPGQMQEPASPPYPYGGPAESSPYSGGAYQKPQSRVGLTVPQWFANYDQIRRQSQLNPQERQAADAMLTRGMSILMPGPDKIVARGLLAKLVSAYANAAYSMSRLPAIPQTQQLHQGYLSYFNTAHQLFSDYLKVQDNPFALDKVTGKPVAGQLLMRKMQLESLNNSIQELDQQMRNQFGIPPYNYNRQG